MHDATAAMLRKLRSARGRNIWVEDFTRKTPDCLFGRPVITCTSRPRAEHGKLAILFGDFSQYLIGDRGHRSVKRLTEVYARQGMPCTKKGSVPILYGDFSKICIEDCGRDELWQERNNGNTDGARCAMTGYLNCILEDRQAIWGLKLM